MSVFPPFPFLRDRASHPPCSRPTAASISDETKNRFNDNDYYYTLNEAVEHVVRHDYGVPLYLRYREPDATIASVAFIAADDQHPSTIVQTDSLAFDYFWLLPESRAPLAEDPHSGIEHRTDLVQR